MKTTLYNAAEATGIMYALGDQLLDGLLGLKIFDNGEILAKKAEFLAKETQKIGEAFHAVPKIAGDPSSVMVVLDADGNIDAEKTSEFTERVMALRNTEIDVNVQPFTKDELQTMKLKPRFYASIRFMVQEKPANVPELKVVQAE